MEKITSLTKKLANEATRYRHLKNLTFKQGEVFSWDHTACVISYDPTAPHAAALLLHEFAHACLNHTTYESGIALLEMERDAWQRAAERADGVTVTIPTTLIDDSLDTYRDWLHARSLCPTCGATGIETRKNHYRCLACQHDWRVNEARTCALRRYSNKQRP